MSRLCLLVVLSFLASAAAYGQDSIADQIRGAQNRGEYARAAELYPRLLASGIDTPEIRSNFGAMLHLCGRNREALAQLHIALRRKPALAAANLFAGISEFDLGKFADALPYLRKAVELDSRREEPWLALARAELALRNYEQAQTAYRRAASIDTQSAEAWFGVGTAARAQANAELNRGARVSLDRLKKTHADLEALLNKALDAFTRAAILEPGSARTHLLLAESWADRGMFSQADSEFRKAMELDPKLDGAELGLATELWKQRRFEEAMPLLQQVLAKHPNDPEANGILADIAEHHADLTAAESHAKAALAGNPDLIETRVVLARVYLARKEPARAAAELEKVAAADPDGSYHYLLYRAYRDAGNQARAEAALRAFRALRPKPDY